MLDFPANLLDYKDKRLAFKAIKYYYDFYTAGLSCILRQTVYSLRTIMKQLKFEKLEIQAANFDYKPNPLPQLKQLKSVPWPVEPGNDVRPDDRKYMNYGCQTPLLPYYVQDNYDRNRSKRILSTFVLENKYLRAAFLGDFGGRLWSLVYKPLNRELLYVNPVFQPANLAYRDAWFSGGVEWNMGMPAHHPFTCEKPFFAVVEDNGTSFLRMYEWERIRNAPYQVDFYLPEDSRVLYVRTKLINPYKCEIPGYWFSNIAVPENAKHRVIAPAEMAYTFDYSPDRFGVKTAQIPVNNGLDLTYPTNITAANDFFYRLDDEQWPWIASLDENGCGLFETSTSRLKGRKLFVWGMGDGGRRWQDFLSEPGHPYIEIQAGFGRTQVECIPLEPNSQTQWLEAYGYIEANPSIVHGSDWRAAQNEVQNRIGHIVTLEDLERQLKETDGISNRRPTDIIQYGSGWGALERKAAGIDENRDFAASGIIFPDKSLSAEQEQWLELLETGSMRECNPKQHILSCQTASNWKKLLVKSIIAQDGKNWTAYYLLGLMHYSEGLYDQAKEVFEKSIGCLPNYLSYRILAFITHNAGETAKALDYMAAGWKLSDRMPQFAQEYGDMLADAGMFDDCNKLLSSLDVDMKKWPRLQILQVRTAFAKGDYDIAERILDNIVLVNIRECETTLTDIWFDIQAIKTSVKLKGKSSQEIRSFVRANLKPPVNIDFRMN